jgi:tetratricopeptide (TPR) repeat protein
VLSVAFAVKPSTHPARPASIAASARRRTAAWILPHLYLLCLLLLLGGLAAIAQNSSSPPQQSTSPITRSVPKDIDSDSAVTNNGVKAEPLTPDPALAQARLFLKQGKLTEAEAATRTHLHAHQDSADPHFLLGFILFREVQGKWLEGAKEDGEGLRYNSGNLSGFLVVYRDQKVKESLAEFTAGAKYHAPNAFDLKIVALDYLLLKDYLDADHWLTRSLQRDPRDPQAWYYLGRTRYSESKFPEAIEAFTQCLKLEPHNPQAENKVGLSYEALGQPDQAVQAFENAIAWDAENAAKDPEPFIELAHLYLNRNQPETAVKYLTQSIDISPKVSKAHKELGRAYSLLHRLPEAQAELEKAIALEPATGSLHCMLGKIYRQENMVPEAKAEFERCEALDHTPSRNSSAEE